MSDLNLWQKIVEVRKIASGFNKDKHSYGYSYVSGNQVLGKIKEKMNELNLLLIPSTRVGEHHTHAYKTSKGKDALDFVVKGEMIYTWINGDKPEEREIISWAYYGQQDEISKAYGSGLTYSERYFLLKCLGLPTDEDDPDAKNTDPSDGYQQRGQNNRNQGRQNQTPPKEEEKIPAALKAKYQMGKGSQDGLESWVSDQKKKGRSFEDMEKILMDAIEKKQAAS